MARKILLRFPSDKEVIQAVRHALGRQLMVVAGVFRDIAEGLLLQRPQISWLVSLGYGVFTLSSVSVIRVK